MKKPYIKKYSAVSKFAVWIVNGQYIRENIDEEFTNFGQHYRFNFIPENEFWIDKEHGEEEEASYFIQTMLIMNRLMSKGVTREEAIKKADKSERRERRKSEFFKNMIGKTKKRDEELNKIHKQLIKEYSQGKIKVWIVRGSLVRDLFFLDFTEGGHDKVYNFVSANEVWLDDDVSQKERKFVFLHEIHERNLMAKGWDYEKAHFDSSKIEYHCRHYPEELNGAIKKELNKANIN